LGGANCKTDESGQARVFASIDVGAFQQPVNTVFLNRCEPIHGRFRLAC
jgi:hypothetical protein